MPRTFKSYDYPALIARVGHAPLDVLTVRGDPLSADDFETLARQVPGVERALTLRTIEDTDRIKERVDSLLLAVDSSEEAVGGEFDDLVLWESRYVLFGRMISSGQLP